nr:hypothetical protein [Tanacetum cinerariifolium]
MHETGIKAAPMEEDPVERHLGSSRMYDGPRRVVYKVINTGYYWPPFRWVLIMRSGAVCQEYTVVLNFLKDDMISVTLAWPFMKCEIDMVGSLPEAPKKFRVQATIITDNGTQLINEPFMSWVKVLEIKFISTSMYHLQANRAVERSNKSLIQGSKTRLHKEGAGWVEELQNVLWAHHTKTKTSNGETLFNLAYGTKPVILTEIGMPTHRTAQRNEVGNEEEL